mmetsp:Transcript_10383/g.17428  ORF Transcript_10383/g.17428 Transcript_10383/m.17428 type:complete len:167 (+) Transcript_10383:472-972(+)
MQSDLASRSLHGRADPEAQRSLILRNLPCASTQTVEHLQDNLAMEYRQNLKYRLFQKQLVHKKEFPLTLSLASSIPSPAQLLIEFIKGLISSYQNYFTMTETGEPTKVVENITSFSPLEVKVSLVNCKTGSAGPIYLKIVDNGPGMSYYQIKEALSGEVSQFKLTQ